MSDEIEPVSDERIERYVWSRIGKESARDMAKALGVSPEEILRVKKNLVEEVDAISLEVQKARLMRTLQELADDAMERSKDISSEFFAGTINASVGAIKTLLVELNRTSKQDSEAVARLNELRTREILRLIDSTVNKTLDEISETYDLDRADLTRMFRGHLDREAKAMEGL